MSVAFFLRTSFFLNVHLLCHERKALKYELFSPINFWPEFPNIYHSEKHTVVLNLIGFFFNFEVNCNLQGTPFIYLLIFIWKMQTLMHSRKDSRHVSHHSHAPTFFSDLRVVLVAKTTKFLAIFFFFHLLNNEFIFILEKLS